MYRKSSQHPNACQIPEAGAHFFHFGFIFVVPQVLKQVVNLSCFIWKEEKRFKKKKKHIIIPKKYTNQLLFAHSTGNPDEIYNKGIFLFKCILSKMEGNRIEVKLSFQKKQKIISLVFVISLLL